MPPKHRSQMTRPAPLLARMLCEMRLGAGSLPRELSSDDMTSITTALTVLGSVGLSRPDLDLSSAAEFRAALECTAPGTYRVELAIVDRRSRLRRLLPFFGPTQKVQADRLLHDTCESIVTGLELAPTIVMSDSVQVSSQVDDAGFITVIGDGQHVVRVPSALFTTFATWPAVGAAIGEILRYRVGTTRSLVIDRDIDVPSRRRETVVDFPPGFFEKLRHRPITAFLNEVSVEGDSLATRLTTVRRPESASTRDVGPRDLPPHRRVP